MEVLVAVIDDGTVLAAGSDVANTLFEGKDDNHHWGTLTANMQIGKQEHCV